MRTASFFQVRDELNREFLRGSDMAGPTRAIFRHLLECTLYAGEAYGWVRHDACGVSTIARITGYSERAVKEHLRLLEANGLIRRYNRTKGTKGRKNDEIRIDWEYLYEDQGAAPALRYQGAGAAPMKADQGAAPAPSSYIEEKNYKEPCGTDGRVIEMRRARV